MKILTRDNFRGFFALAGILQLKTTDLDNPIIEIKFRSDAIMRAWCQRISVVFDFRE